MESVLQKAIDIIEDNNFIYGMDKLFDKIYPFTTENIAGYIDYFDIYNKSLLTVGSSGDQVINAILYGARKVTLLDINSFSEYFLYLKLAAIKVLSYKEFMKFFSYFNYPNNLDKNELSFNKELFQKLSSELKSMHYESFLFWHALYSKFHPLEIRENLFQLDEGSNKMIINANPYLKSISNYNILKELIDEANIKFLNQDVNNINVEDSFDNIWLSNVYNYLSGKNFVNSINNLNNYLNINGKFMIVYLYYYITSDDRNINSYLKNILSKSVFKSDYKLVNIPGINSIESENFKTYDSIVLYKKRGNGYV